MADNPPPNREQRRAARFGRHRVDARDAHDPWPESQPNPALGDAAEAVPGGEQAVVADEAAEPEGKTPVKRNSETKPKG